MKVAADYGWTCFAGAEFEVRTERSVIRRMFIPCSTEQYFQFQGNLFATGCILSCEA